VKYNYMAPAPIRLDAEGAATRLNGLFKGLEARGVADLTRDGFTKDRITIRRSLDMRYVGQVHECTVDIDPFDIDDAALSNVIDAFHARHEELYTYSERQSTVEVVNVESAIWGRVDRPNRMTVAPGIGAASALEGTRPMIFDASAVPRDCPVYAGARLGAGDRIIGPAVIEEVTTTLVIEPGWEAELHESGVYVVNLIVA
jgi:N-methylhydantoinase A